jgi:hypothetical protein
MVVVLEVPIITPIQPMVATQLIVTNSFGSIFGTPRYNTQSIPMTSSPFSYGMSNVTSQFFSSILVNNTNPSIGIGGMASLHIPLSFGGAHIPQTTPTAGSLPPFHPDIILVLMLMDGVINQEDKLLLMFHPLHLPPPHQFRPTRLA